MPLTYLFWGTSAVDDCQIVARLHLKHTKKPPNWKKLKIQLGNCFFPVGKIKSGYFYCITFPYAMTLFVRQFFPIWAQLILNVNYNICKRDILVFYDLAQESLPPNLHLLIIGKVFAEKHGVGIV